MAEARCPTSDSKNASPVLRAVPSTIARSAAISSWSIASGRSAVAMAGSHSLDSVGSDPIGHGRADSHNRFGSGSVSELRMNPESAGAR